MDIQENVSGIVVLIIGVSLGIVIMIFMSSISAEMFAATEPSIEALTGSGTTTSSENFNDDTIGSNPSESWYTYSESGWDYANVYGTG